MPKLHIARDRYETGLHHGAAKSLKLSIGVLKEYRQEGVLPRVGNDVGLRREFNDRLRDCIKLAEQRGAEKERRRISAMLRDDFITPMDRSNDAEDKVVVPLRRRRAAR